MEIKNWLVNKISEESGLNPNEVNCDATIDTLNLDSLATISIAFDIETEYNLTEINPSVFSEYNTINKLASWIQSQI